MEKIVFLLTFAMPLMNLLVLICNTKLSENSDKAKSRATFVALELIRKFN